MCNEILVFSVAIAIMLTVVMGQRYLQTSKIMPAGIVAGIRYVKKWTFSKPHSSMINVSCMSI